MQNKQITIDSATDRTTSLKVIGSGKVKSSNSFAINTASCQDI